MRIVALCGSLRAGSFNQALLDVAIERGPAHGLEIVQADIREFPPFNQDLEGTPPPAVLEAKRIIQTGETLLLVSPETNYGVPGVLKNAIDWLSRPAHDPTLYRRPMAVAGVSTGYMGTMRAQLAWRQMWHYFNAPVFSGVELTVPLARTVFDGDGRIADTATVERLDAYLSALSEWVMQCQRAAEPT
ncbi:MAG: NAD(P)H-dependent oxidoreductase [Actinobacteria bacterium]|nr:MAG: NAD(P)H-dependent oxidoreductase [Actinomycetota bacterium]